MKPSKNALLEVLAKFGKAQPRRPPGDGWQTLEELAAAEGVTRGTIRYRMNTAQKNGVKLETATGIAVDAEGKAKRATYWRLKL